MSGSTPERLPVAAMAALVVGACSDATAPSLQRQTVPPPPTISVDGARELPNGIIMYGGAAALERLRIDATDALADGRRALSQFLAQSVEDPAIYFRAHGVVIPHSVALARVPARRRRLRSLS